MATNAANTPFNLPVAPVAGFNPTQNQAFQQYQNLQGSAQPYYNQAQQDIQSSAQPLTGQQISNYYNPYASAVMANLQESQGQQMQDLTGRSTQTAGGVGADRIGVAQGELARQQNLATGQTASGIYQSALNAAQQQQQMTANAGYGMTNLGTSVLGANMQGTGALLASGNQQQAQQQAQLNAPYQNQLAQLAYPFQTAQYLAGITGGLSGAMGGTTSGQGTSTGPAPSIWSQLLGAGVGAAGAAGSMGAFNSGPSALYPGSSIPGSVGPTSVGGAPLSARGGAVGYAAGGSAGSAMGNPDWMDSDPILPQMQIQSSGNHPLLNLNPPSQSAASSGPSAGDIGKMVMQIAPMFLSQGGMVNPSLGVQAFADGGDLRNFDGSFDDASSAMGEMPLAMAQNHYLQGTGAYPIGGNNPHTPMPSPPPPPQPSMAAGPPSSTPAEQPPVFGPDGKMMGNMTSGQGQPPQQAPPLPPPQEVAGGPGMGAPGAGGPMRAPPPPPPPPDTTTSLDQKLPYPDLDQVHDTSRNFAKSPWTALMNAGFAMMAGTSPFAGVNIGKGLQAGVQTLEQQRKDLATEEGVNQKAKQLAQQAQFHRDQYEKMTPYQKQELEVRKQQIQMQAQALGLRGWIPINENPVDGSKTLYNKSTNEVRIVHADGTVENGVLGDPGKVSSSPDKLSENNTPSGVSTPVEASPLREPQLASNLVPPKVDTSNYRKGSPALTQANAENTHVTTLHTKEANNMGNEDILVQQSKQQFGVLMKDADSDGFLTKMATMRGNNVDERIRYARSINEAARAAGKPPVINPEKLAAMEVISKDQRTLGMLFASNLSSREAFAGQQVGIESTPGLTQSPLGMLRLLAGYDSQLQYTRDKHAFYENYIKENKGIPTGWEQAFQKQNPVDRYIVRSMMENLPDRHFAEKLPEAVKILKEHPHDPAVVTGFNKRYGNTASYWLTGHLDMLGAQ